MASFRRQLTAGTARRIQDTVVPLACGNEAHGAASGCEQPYVPFFGHWPSPLPREWLRFPCCKGSGLMRFARLMTVKASSGRPLKA
jgi:hypothetical protein